MEAEELMVYPESYLRLPWIPLELCLLVQNLVYYKVTCFVRIKLFGKNKILHPTNYFLQDQSMER